LKHYIVDYYNNVTNKQNNIKEEEKWAKRLIRTSLQRIMYWM
jgi:hypothetical protein